jgi:hypothetical protein
LSAAERSSACGGCDMSSLATRMGHNSTKIYHFGIGATVIAVTIRRLFRPSSTGRLGRWKGR